MTKLRKKKGFVICVVPADTMQGLCEKIEPPTPPYKQSWCSKN